MIPPAWALVTATRLDLDEFGAAFASAWARIESRFLKLECWQVYQESIHDYGTAAVGRQTGGWLTHQPDVIATLETIVSALRRQAVPLHQYLARVQPSAPS